jgi:hypothetical protein
MDEEIARVKQNIQQREQQARLERQRAASNPSAPTPSPACTAPQTSPTTVPHVEEGGGEGHSPTADSQSETHHLHQSEFSIQISRSAPAQNEPTPIDAHSRTSPSS